MRGEGNHKIPGSFAPENMEKTGAERVKYSLACQHEDAIPIKFVSYAQKCPTVLCTFAVALRKESVDRNVNPYKLTRMFGKSLSARRAWIEMCDDMYLIECRFRSLSARRAWIEIYWPWCICCRPRVALRKESVDRNIMPDSSAPGAGASLSARRAWIEMFEVKSFDRDYQPSLSARRAWIEIPENHCKFIGVNVALRKESVDRNNFFLPK